MANEWIDILHTRPVSLKNYIFAPEPPDVLWSHNLWALQLQNTFQVDHYVENQSLKVKAEEMQDLKWKVYFFCLQMHKQLATCLRKQDESEFKATCSLVGDLPQDKPEGVGLLDGVRSIFEHCLLR